MSDEWEYYSENDYHTTSWWRRRVVSRTPKGRPRFAIEHISDDKVQAVLAMHFVRATATAPDAGAGAK